MNCVSINGNTYEVPSGSSISVINNQVIINGKPYDATGIVEIKVTGSINLDRCDSSLTVNGNITALNDKITVRGSLNCGEIHGDLDVGGSVNCGKVTGSVRAGGSIRTG